MTEQKQPVDPFTVPAREGELNLIESTQKALEAAGLKLTSDSAFTTHEIYAIGKPLCFEAQRFLLNRFFNTQLHHIGVNQKVDTREERYCLLDEGSPEQWLTSFQSKILPVLVSHNYPVVI